MPGKHNRALMFSVLMAGLLSGLGWGQSYNGTITGTVSDPTGAVVPGVQLTLTSVATTAVAKASSGPAGLYSFPNLLPGAYELKASAQGFREYVQRGITVNFNETAHVDVKLELGPSVQKVEVSANATPLNMANAELKGSITPEILQELPLEVSGNIRSAANFAVLMPGVSTGSGNSAFDARINGGLQSGDEAIVDGVSLQEGLMSQSGMVSIQNDYPWSPDVVSEVSVLTSNYEPQYGSSTSGQIIVETKSGTNRYHGAFYEYHRNTVLNARQFGVADRPPDLENEFGGSLGGPLWIPHLWPKSKRTFFFLNLEGFRNAGGITTPILSVPTPQERQGDFRDWVDSNGNLIPVYDPDTLRPNPGFDSSQDVGPNNLPFLRDQFMGCDGKTPNVICPTDPRLENSLAPQWFKFLPAPNRPGIFNNYAVPKPRPSYFLYHPDYLDLRVDQYVRNSDHVSATVYYVGNHPNTTSELPPPISFDAYGTPEYGFVDRLNWDHTFSPTVLNHAAFGYLNWEEGVGSIDAKYANQLPQIPGVPSHNYPPLITISGFTTMGDQNGDPSKNITARPDATLNDLLTWVRGRHTLKIGGEYRWLGENNRTRYGESGTFNFASGETGLEGFLSGSPVASFLLSEVDSASATFRAVASNYPRATAYILHAGDTWQITPKLSINYGLRWDTFTPAVEKHDEQTFLDTLGSNPGAGGRAGRLAFAGTRWGAASFGRRAPEYTWHKGFQPRFGLAYRLGQRTVIRSGYGIFFTQMFYPGWGGGTAQDGFSFTPSFSSSNAGLTAAFLLSQGFPQNFARPPFIDRGFLNGQNSPNYRPFDSNRRPNAQQWNLAIEHQFTADFYISTAYVANKGTRLPSRTVPINALDPKYLALGGKLYDEFGPSDTVVDGVPAPYPAWASQMSGCAASVAQALVPYPQYCNVIYGLTENAGNTTYHSFQIKAEKRFSRGLWMLTSYTLSKTIGSADQTQADSLLWSGAHGVISPFERKRNKALAIDDVPQTLSQAFVYELPFGKGKRWANRGGVVNILAGRWTVSSVFRITSGIPFFFRSAFCNIPGQFAAGCIPGIIPGTNPWAQDRSHFDPNKPLFNQAAFEPYQNFNFYLGQGPRISNLRGFGYHNHDLTLIKDIQLTERAKFQLRAEFFNIWNWHIFATSGEFGYSAFDTSVGDPLFGIWNGSVSNPRNVQIVGRITF